MFLPDASKNCCTYASLVMSSRLRWWSCESGRFCFCSAGMDETWINTCCYSMKPLKNICRIWDILLKIENPSTSCRFMRRWVLPHVDTRGHHSGGKADSSLELRGDFWVYKLLVAYVYAIKKHYDMTIKSWMISLITCQSQLVTLGPIQEIYFYNVWESPRSYNLMWFMTLK